MLVSRSVKLQTICGQQFNNKGLAEAADMSTSYLSLILNGKRMPSQAALQKMARALQVDVTRLRRELYSRNAR